MTRKMLNRPQPPRLDEDVSGQRKMLNRPQPPRLDEDVSEQGRSFSLELDARFQPVCAYSPRFSFVVQSP